MKSTLLVATTFAIAVLNVGTFPIVPLYSELLETSRVKKFFSSTSAVKVTILFGGLSILNEYSKWSSTYTMLGLAMLASFFPKNLKAVSPKPPIIKALPVTMVIVLIAFPTFLLLAWSVLIRGSVKSAGALNSSLVVYGPMASVALLASVADLLAVLSVDKSLNSFMARGNYSETMLGKEQYCS